MERWGRPGPARGRDSGRSRVRGWREGGRGPQMSKQLKRRLEKIVAHGEKSWQPSPDANALRKFVVN